LILPFACDEYSLSGLRNNVKAIAYGALFWIGLVAPVSAGYDEGRGAYARGDYVTAFHEWLDIGLNGHQGSIFRGCTLFRWLRGSAGSWTGGQMVPNGC
jgi:hypothetical protein